MKAKTTYQTEFKILSDAGNGVILTRAREPFRVIAALRELAFASATPTDFRVWNVVGGWHAHDHAKPENPPQRDKTGNPQAAIKKIADMDGDGSAAFPDGIFVMDGLHPFLGGSTPDPLLVSVLRSYAYNFATTGRRLVLVCPETFVLPPELQHDIPTLDYELPDREELGTVLDEILESAFAEGAVPVRVFNDDERDALVASASGMTRLEAEGAFGQAVVRNLSVFPAVPFDAFNRVVLTTKTDVVKRSETLELMQAGSLDDVGGLDQLKAWIALRKSCFTKAAQDFGADKPLGVALIGPPGTGKSLSAKAIAASLGQPLIRFDVSRVFGSLIGQTEARVAATLKQLASMAPCVAFIDEIDKAGLGPNQGGGDTGVGKRCMSSILTFMQESPAPIFWLFTSNRHQELDPALLRKGRLDEVFAVLPPNRVERLAVLGIHLRKRKQDPDAIADLGLAVDASEGYVSAEIEGAVKDAVITAFNTGCAVTGALIAEQLANMTPISVAFADDFEQMRTWAANNARLASTPENGSVKGMDAKRLIPVPAERNGPRRRRIGH